jgi:hypothetical protein
MTSGARLAILQVVGSGQTREYVLELDVESDPIEGRVSGGGEGVEFTGWLGLASAIERMISVTGEPANEEATEA